MLSPGSTCTPMARVLSGLMHPVWCREDHMCSWGLLIPGEDCYEIDALSYDLIQLKD